MRHAEEDRRIRYVEGEGRKIETNVQGERRRIETWGEGEEED